MDVAWKLGSSGAQNDWALRISMRSFWLNYAPKARFWIVGTIPAWINRDEVCCIPFPDPYRRCKDANLLHKALRLALEPQLSDPFIYLSDDQILLRPSIVADFELWHGGQISEQVEEGSTKWQRRLHNTGVRLRSADLPASNFEMHVPYPMRKQWIGEALRFNFASRPGMCVHTTILNASRQAGKQIPKSIRAWMSDPSLTNSVIDSQLATCRFASLTDESLENLYLVEQLERLFPQPAPWELDGTSWPRLSRR